MHTDIKPRVLVVYFSLTQQSARVAEAMAQALTARGCDVTRAAIEFADERWMPKLSQFPMKRPIPQLASILPAQLRHETSEIRIPPEAQERVFGLTMPPPNLRPDFEEQVRSFVGGVLDQIFGAPVAAGGKG